MAASLRVLAAVAEVNDFKYQITSLPIGGAAIDEGLSSLSEKTLAVCQKSDTILLEAIGGPKWAVFNQIRQLLNILKGASMRQRI